MTNKNEIQQREFLPRSLFGPQIGTPNLNPLDLLSRVAVASSASSLSFQAARDASTAFLKKPPPANRPSHSPSTQMMYMVPSDWRNPWFKEASGEKHLPYADNWEFSPEDGQRTGQFLPPMHDFPAWLTERKHTWRMKYNLHKHDSEKTISDALEINQVKKRSSHSPSSPSKHIVSRTPSNLRNPWFKDASEKNYLPYDDNWEFSPEDGQRAEQFLPPIHNFPAWLNERKQFWRTNYKLYKYDSAQNIIDALEINQVKKRSSHWPSKQVMSMPPSNWRNPWFKDASGENSPFDDNWEFSAEDGQRAEQFLPPIHEFPAWLTERKQFWRTKYKLYKYDTEKSISDALEIDQVTVARDFWIAQEFASFENWLDVSLKKWKISYSWNRKKTQRIQEECESIVHLSQEPNRFQDWIRIRRNQWRLLRRKRQRQRNEQVLMNGNTHPSPCLTAGVEASHGGSDEGLEATDLSPRKRRKIQAPTLTDIAAIDVILEQEDQDRKRREAEKRRLVDISFLFDASLGAPDDIVVLCFSFLDSSEYSKFLCINKTYSDALKAREEVWKQLCPSHWILPRRPRKPWHELYFHRLRIEQRDSQKLWDDILVKCSAVLFKGDHLQKIEKLVKKGEKDFGFDVNYVSPVVCERNSILNLAVIHQRHKVVRWLVDQKRADIESYDRGHFTTLLNAAWAGDRQTVRFLLQRGADRTKIGYGHYSRALAHPDFEGLTAEGWARKRGHDDVAKLIRLGL